MELIPILSLIILVATLCTFILAVGAYYHYKSKAGKDARLHQPDAISAELVTPTPLMRDQYSPRGSSGDFQRFVTRAPSNMPGRPEHIPDYSFRQVRKGSAYSQAGYTRSASTYEERRRPGHKFLRYTPSGYLDPLTDTQLNRKKVANEIRWR